MKIKTRILQIIKWLFLIVVFILPSILIYYSLINHELFYLVVGVLILLIGILFILPYKLFDRSVHLPSLKIKRLTLEPKLNNVESIITPTIKAKVFNRTNILIILCYVLLTALASSLLCIKFIKIPANINTNMLTEKLYLFLILKNGIRYIFLLLIPAFATLIAFISLLIVKKTPIKRIGIDIFCSIILLALLLVPSVVLGMEFARISSLSEVYLARNILQNTSKLSKAGILTDPKEITQKIKESNKVPIILSDNPNLTQEVVSLLISNKGRSGFYSNVLTRDSFKSLNIKVEIPGNVLLLGNNTLIVKTLDKSSFETISPSLARLIVSTKFNPMYIKEEPSVSLMGRQEYMKYRENQINDNIKKIDEVIAEVQSWINTYSSRIAEARNKIGINQNGLSESRSSRDEAYKSCKDAGYYSYFDYSFIRFYTDSECEQRKGSWDSIINQFNKNISDWQSILKANQTYLADAQQTKTNLVAYREVVATQKDTTPSELGIFEPPDTVRVVLESIDDKALADYLATLTHEYLHYTSYVSEERTLERFFEEGITEYFSRKAIKEEFGTSTNIGYPVYVPIITKIASDIGEQELEAIYFTKDTDRLKIDLNAKYGKDFYTDTEYYFQVLGYLPDTEALKTANNILFKIGADPISETDLYSTQSVYKKSTYSE